MVGGVVIAVAVLLDIVHGVVVACRCCWHGNGQRGAVGMSDVCCLGVGSDAADTALVLNAKCRRGSTATDLKPKSKCVFGVFMLSNCPD